MTSARDLSSRLADLLRREHSALADFLVALADFDRERRWVELGHASLFYYLHRELGLSKGAAFYRKTAAELIQEFPEVVEPLRDGRLCLTTVVELSKVLTPENRGEVLPRFYHRSKTEAKVVSAELRPVTAPPRREVMTAARVERKAAVGGAHALALGQPAVHPANRLLDVNPQSPGPTSFPASPDSPAHARRPEVEPLDAESRRLHLTVSRRFLEKLEAARTALSHSHRGASAEEILEAGLDLLLERHAKRKGQVAKPRREPPAAKPDHLPAHVKRAVWKRDGGRCQYPLEGGGVCGSTYRVQFDHVEPRGRGGPSTVANVRCACLFHNQLAARQIYGDGWMNRFTRGRGARPAGGSRPAPDAP